MVRGKNILTSHKYTCPKANPQQHMHFTQTNLYQIQIVVVKICWLDMLIESCGKAQQGAVNRNGILMLKPKPDF